MMANYSGWFLLEIQQSDKVICNVVIYMLASGIEEKRLNRDLLIGV